MIIKIQRDPKRIEKSYNKQTYQFEEQKQDISPSHLICQDEYPFQNPEILKIEYGENDQYKEYKGYEDNDQLFCGANQEQLNFIEQSNEFQSQNNSFFEFENSPHIQSQAYNIFPEFSRQNSFSLQDPNLRQYLVNPKMDTSNAIHQFEQPSEQEEQMEDKTEITQEGPVLKEEQDFFKEDKSQVKEFEQSTTHSNSFVEEKPKVRKLKQLKTLKNKKKFNMSAARETNTKILKKGNKIMKKRSAMPSQSGFESLALRNIKTNLASGLIQFISFKYSIDIQNGKTQNSDIYQEIVSYLYQKFPLLRSFSGWREIWNDKVYGKRIKKLSLAFFGKSFAKYYILGSRVKENYKNQYRKKIKKFYEGALNPSNFNSFSFNN